MSYSKHQKFDPMHTIYVFLLTFLVVMGCRDGGTSQKSTSTQNTTPNTNLQINNQPGTNRGAEASSEFHYICVNNCEGSGANAAGDCPVCGEELVHNTAFHSDGNDNSTPQIIGADDNSFTSKIAPLGKSSQASEAPAQAPVTGDASFHYICSASCGGGGDAQGNCPSCGAELVHNAAFHTNQGASALPGSAPSGNSSGNKYPSIFNTPGAANSAPVLNNSGTFHYICSAGCGSGGNAQGSCPSCGSALVHNDAYHL